MKNMVKLSFQEMAQIVANHLTQKGQLTPGTGIDLTWHWDRFTLDGSYVIFEQGGMN